MYATNFNFDQGEDVWVKDILQNNAMPVSERLDKVSDYYEDRLTREALKRDFGAYKLNNVVTRMGKIAGEPTAVSADSADGPYETPVILWTGRLQDGRLCDFKNSEDDFIGLHIKNRKGEEVTVALENTSTVKPEYNAPRRHQSNIIKIEIYKSRSRSNSILAAKYAEINNASNAHVDMNIFEINRMFEASFTDWSVRIWPSGFDLCVGLSNENKDYFEIKFTPDVEPDMSNPPDSELAGQSNHQTLLISLASSIEDIKALVYKTFS